MIVILSHLNNCDGYLFYKLLMVILSYINLDVEEDMGIVTVDMHI